MTNWKLHTCNRDEFAIVRDMEVAQARVVALMPSYKALEKRCRKRMEREQKQKRLSSAPGASQ